MITKFEFDLKKNYTTLIVFIPLLCFLIYIEFILIKNLNLSDFKTILVIAIFGLYLLFVFRTFCWTLFGKEQVQITADDLIILKRRTILSWPRTYHLREIKNLRIENQQFSFSDFFVSRTSLTSLKSFGCIVFDYENKVINFGGNVDKRSAEDIIGILKTKINVRN